MAPGLVSRARSSKVEGAPCHGSHFVTSRSYRLPLGVQRSTFQPGSEYAGNMSRLRSDFPLHSPCYLLFENPWYWFENSRKRAKYSNSEEYDDLSHLIDSDRTISGYPRTFLPTIRGEIYRRRGRLLTTKIGVSDGGGGPDDDDNRTRMRRPRQR